jgi:N-acetyl-gamma-glutamyl-phosphate reductase
MDVGIVGASGFTGLELLRLCAARTDLTVRAAAAEAHAGARIGDVHRSLALVVGDQRFVETEVRHFDGLDLVFCCLPHGVSQQFVPELVDRVGTVVDLGADFRLRDPELWEAWYGEPHHHPELLGTFAYGLPELFADELVGARRVAAPGCYPTAAGLALAPFVRAGAVEDRGVVVDAASGVSGAGAAPTRAGQFTTVDGDFTAYGLLRHRHTPEMEQAIGAEVLFTPHLAPMSRGILATCYARPVDPRWSTADALGVLADHYRDRPFVHVSEAVPSTKATLGSNAAHVTARVDPRTGWLVALCAIDNLGKGASGQAMQAANVSLGLPEASGLSAIGLVP